MTRPPPSHSRRTARFCSGLAPAHRVRPRATYTSRLDTVPLMFIPRRQEDHGPQAPSRGPKETTLSASKPPAVRAELRRSAVRFEFDMLRSRLPISHSSLKHLGS